MNKETEALSIVEKSLSLSTRPMVFSSFGKDSVVMLDLVRRFVPDVPVVYLMDGTDAAKNLHAFTVAAKMGLTLHNYPPSASEYYQNGDYFEVVHFFYINGTAWYALFNGCRQFVEGEKFACAVHDLINIPSVDSYTFRWDCIFHGHKQTDNIHITEQYKIGEPIVEFGNGIMSMPLYNWSDADVWEYINRHSLEVQGNRYQDNPSGRATGDWRDEKSCDVVPTCLRCIDLRNAGEEVVCPKTGEKMPFCGKSVEAHERFREFMLKSGSYIEIKEG